MTPAGNDLTVALRIEIERLVDEFSGAYARDCIESCVGRAMQRYAGVRVTTFVPVLVYRDVCDRLRQRRGESASQQEG